MSEQQENKKVSDLLKEMRACRMCANFLPNEPRPILQASENSKLLIIGQAPGSKVQQTGVPWNDASGKNLREWLQISETVFYDANQVALMPLGFCYPGKGASGDLPPRSECAPLWHQRLLEVMPSIKLTLLIGSYAQNYYLKDRAKPTLTETVRAFENYLPQYFPLPHPSPRNRLWMFRNQWFEELVLPSLRWEVKFAWK